MEIKTVSIIGLGAIGILFAQHLSKRMPPGDLRIIADQERIQRYQTDFVYCNGERCEFNYQKPEDLGEPADLIIFAVKYKGLKEAIRAVRNQVGEHTILLSALNGITSETMIGQTYGLDKILYCTAQGMDAVKVGNRLTYAHMGMLVFGEREPGFISERVKRVARFLESKAVPYEAVTDMNKRIWGKFMLNVGVNQTAAVLESNYGGLQIKGAARETMIAAMREVMVLSAKEGINLTETDLKYWLNVLEALSPEGKPSMRQDMEAQRFSEVELFSGAVLEFGKKHSVSTPVNEEFYRRIKEIEAKY